MAKLYFRYGVMGSSKTAQALISKFNYEQGNNRVLFIKPSIDNRDGADIVESRIGLKAYCCVIYPEDNIFDYVKNLYEEDKPKVIICDESQFFTEEQINQLKLVAIDLNIVVMCYGLLTDFQTKLFTGSKRLVEIADRIEEIKMVCDCGAKAQVNARLINGEIALDGDQVFLGGDESYKAMCYKCYLSTIKF